MDAEPEFYPCPRCTKPKARIAGDPCPTCVRDLARQDAELAAKSLARRAREISDDARQLRVLVPRLAGFRGAQEAARDALGLAIRAACEARDAIVLMIGDEDAAAAAAKAAYDGGSP